MIYDMDAEAATDAIPPGGMMGQISFRRLAAVFRETGELRENERITHFIIRRDGILEFYVETKS